MTDEEYTTMFLEMLKYVPYLKDEMAKVQRFVNGFPLSFKNWIKYDEPQSLEEVIERLKHCYEHSKCNFEPKSDWKGNDKTKGNSDKK